MKPYELPELSFAYDTLEPFMDEESLRIHHDEIHRNYVEKLNDVLGSYPEFAKPVEELLASLHYLPKEIEEEVCRNAGGHANHTLFWTCIKPDGEGAPFGNLGTEIDGQLSGFSSFKEKFTKLCEEHFSSGWGWLASDLKGHLSIFCTKDHENPITDGKVPLLAMDLWEHAYFLKHLNRRAEYLEDFWGVVNWKEVGARWDDSIQNGMIQPEWKKAG